MSDSLTVNKKKPKFTETQIGKVLKENEADRLVEEINRERGIN